MTLNYTYCRLLKAQKPGERIKITTPRKADRMLSF